MKKAEIKDKLRANLFDGQDGGILTVHVDSLLEDIAEILGDDDDDEARMKPGYEGAVIAGAVNTPEDVASWVEQASTFCGLEGHPHYKHDCRVQPLVKRLYGC